MSKGLGGSGNPTDEDAMFNKKHLCGYSCASCEKDLVNSVSVALRPEKIKIETTNNDNCIHASVNNASFVGSTYQYILNSKIGKLYVISGDTSNPFKVGEEVFLSLDEKDVKVLND